MQVIKKHILWFLSDKVGPCLINNVKGEIGLSGKWDKRNLTYR